MADVLKGPGRIMNIWQEFGIVDLERLRARGFDFAAAEPHYHSHGSIVWRAKYNKSLFDPPLDVALKLAKGDVAKTQLTLLKNFLIDHGDFSFSGNYPDFPISFPRIVVDYDASDFKCGVLVTEFARGRSLEDRTLDPNVKRPIFINTVGMLAHFAQQGILVDVNIGSDVIVNVQITEKNGAKTKTAKGVYVDPMPYAGETTGFGENWIARQIVSEGIIIFQASTKTYGSANRQIGVLEELNQNLGQDQTLGLAYLYDQLVGKL